MQFQGGEDVQEPGVLLPRCFIILSHNSMLEGEKRKYGQVAFYQEHELELTHNTFIYNVI